MNMFIKNLTMKIKKRAIDNKPKPWIHCANGSSCCLGHYSQGNAGCYCDCDVCCGLEERYEKEK
jgi:hypothetical protein